MATPWEIGRAHWNQLDLYTKNASIEDDGYGAGPHTHPWEGSFAYVRSPEPAERAPKPPELYEREAWPWETHRERMHPRVREGFFTRLVDRVVSAFIGRPREAEIADETIAVDVRGRLATQLDVDIHDLEVHVSDGEVTLRGSVPGRTMKERAGEIAGACAGVTAVHNKLHVRRDDDVLFLMPLELLAT
jgi:hypothetical protein